MRLGHRLAEGPWDPHETDLYVRLQHCGTQSELIADCIVCEKQSPFPEDPTHLDAYYALWHCGVCGHNYLRYFRMDTSVAVLRAISGTWPQTWELSEEETRYVQEYIQACPTPKQPHSCSCYLHKRAREQGLTVIFLRAAGRRRRTFLGTDKEYDDAWSAGYINENSIKRYLH